MKIKNPKNMRNSPIWKLLMKIHKTLGCNRFIINSQNWKGQIRLLNGGPPNLEFKELDSWFHKALTESIQVIREETKIEKLRNFWFKHLLWTNRVRPKEKTTKMKFQNSSFLKIKTIVLQAKRLNIFI